MGRRKIGGLRLRGGIWHIQKSVRATDSFTRALERVIGRKPSKSLSNGSKSSGKQLSSASDPSAGSET